MYKNILVAVDGSENNRAAVRAAIELAKEFGATLTGAYVEAIGYTLSPDVATLADPMKNADSAFAYMKEEVAKCGIEAKYKVIVGHPGEALVDQTPNYDLIVCGSLGRSGLKRAVLGSVSEMISRFSECPVLIVRK